MLTVLRVTFLPILLGVSLCIAWIFRRARWHVDNESGVAWAATIALACASVLLPDINRYGVWIWLLRDAPLTVQWLLGLALALAPGVVLAEAWLATSPSRVAWAVALTACGAWALVHPMLPVHLSAPDFDDFFVVDKFLGVVGPDWKNDKPFFTVWDYSYRVLEALASVSPLERFRINGWFALVYTVGLGLWLRDCFKGLPDSSARRALPWLLAPSLGPVVLSHTLAYELPCAAWVVATVLVLERLRSASTSPLPVIAVLALARMLQAGGHNATAAAWLPVYAHGVLVLRARRASAGEIAWAMALGVSGVLGFVLEEFAAVHDTVSHFDAGRIRRVLTWGWAPLALGAAAAAAAFAWREGTGALRGWIVATWRAPGVIHVTAVYLAAGAFVYLSANQDNLGLPQPGTLALDREIPWDFGTNHARYALLFYPGLAAMLGATALRTKPLGLVALSLFLPWWNNAYVTRFYRAPHPHALVDGGYHRNTRYLALTRAALHSVHRMAYLPIPRDHGDHFLLLAARPDVSVRSACEMDVRPDEPLFISSHTTMVLRREGAPQELAEFAHDDITLRTVGALSPHALRRWCAQRIVRRHNPLSEEAHTP